MEENYSFNLSLCFFVLVVFGVGRYRGPAGRLDTLHVVVSGQPNATSKPKGLHTGFSGLPLIAVKGGPSYM